MIPDDLRQNPEKALTLAAFAEEVGVREYLETFDDWSYGAGADVLQRAAAVAHELVNRIETREGCVRDDLRVWALRTEGIAYRLSDLARTRKAYDAEERLRLRMKAQKCKPDPLGMSDLRRRVGILENELGNWEASDSAFSDAVDLAACASRHETARAWAAWGACCLERAFKQKCEESYRYAIRFLKTALPMFGRSRPPSARMSCLHNLLLAQIMVGFPEDTIKSTFEAFQDARAAEATCKRTKRKGTWAVREPKNNELDLALCWGQCYLLIRTKQWEKASTMLRKVRLGFVELGNTIDAGTVALDEVLIAAVQERWKLARNRLKEASRILCASGSDVDIARTSGRLSMAILAENPSEVCALLAALNKARTKAPRYPAAVAAGLL